MTDQLATTLPERAEGGVAATPIAGKVGRFVIVDVLGRGGMGIVLGAYDPDLDRKVALKLLHPGAVPAGQAADVSLREARAMAKLSHPNVLPVHEVGTVDGRVFIAMELAAGGTLRAWLAAEPRPWRDVVARFVDAGRGLAAAHAAGLVHRDFKPENVLLSKDGHVRVADFGLVSGEREASGAPVGTPAYMAPEQRAGGVVGPEADQYAFCVSLWEALFGVRPDRDRPVGTPADVPSWLRRVLERGLADDPAARWPSLDALLAALHADPDEQRQRRRRATFALSAGALAIALTAAGTWQLATSDDSPCAARSDRFAGVWDASVRETLAARVRALGKPFADRAFEQIARRLDEQRVRWEGMRHESCVATRVRKEQSDRALDLRAECLERSFGDLQSFVTSLHEPTVAGLDKAVDRAVFVGDVSVCADVAALERRSPLPADPARRAALVELEREISLHRATVRVETGLAPSLTDALVARARALDYAPVTAFALFTAGIDHRLAKRHADARRLLELALLEAEAGGDDMLRFEIENSLADVVGAWLEKFDEGLAHGSRAAAVLKRLRSADPMLEAHLNDTLSGIHWRKGDFRAAKELAERAVATSERLRPDSVETSTYLLGLGIALDALDEWKAGKVVLDRALAITTAALGPDHPRIARVLTTRGGVLRRLDDLDAAEADYTRALAIFLDAYGEASFEAGAAYANLGSLAHSRKKHALSAEYQRKTIAIYERIFGPTHSRTLVANERLGGALSNAGKHEEAVATLERVIAGQRQNVGPDHPWSSNAHFQLGMHYLRRAKQPKLALAAFDEARRALVASQGPESRLLSRVYSALAETYEALDRPRDTVAMYELAIARLGDDPTGDRRASFQFYMADALAKIGQRGRALELARTARATLAAIGDEDLAEVDAWIAKHAR